MTELNDQSSLFTPILKSSPPSVAEPPADVNDAVIDAADSSADTVETHARNSLDKIALAIEAKKTQIAKNFVEIGQLLIEAKGHTDKGYGKWTPWLKQVGIHPRTAQMYMKIAEEFPDAKSISHLGVAKAHVLLALPGEEREPFLNEKHYVRGVPKTVSEMSVNALKEAVKYRKAPPSDVPTQEDGSEKAVEDKPEAEAEKNHATSPESNAVLDAQLESAQKALADVYDCLFEQRSSLTPQDERFNTLHSILDTVKDCIALVETGKP